MARIRMKQTAAGPNGAYQADAEYDLPREEAASYVNAGAAEWVGAQRETAAVKPIESRSELQAMDKADLAALAEERGVEVVRTDGRSGAPRKSDIIAALEG